jgi:hypothetical protein
MNPLFVKWFYAVKNGDMTVQDFNNLLDEYGDTQFGVGVKAAQVLALSEAL